jgi:hypothetical protein
MKEGSSPPHTPPPSVTLFQSLRELGTGLRLLTVLWAPRCGLSGDALDGVGALPALRELYLAFNSLDDLSPLACHDQIQVSKRASGCLILR